MSSLWCVTERSVVITGLGAITADGPARGLEARLARGDGSTGPEEAVDQALDRALSRRERRRQDLASQLATAASREAMQDAGLEGPLPCRAERAGCFVGTALGPSATLHDEYDAFRTGQRISGLTSAWMFVNMPTAHVSMEHDLRGESFGVAAGMGSGLHAIGHAVGCLRAGVLDLAVAGAADAHPGQASMTSLAARGWVADDDRARPFDERGAGLAPRSAAAMLVLEREPGAQGRGAHRYASVSGWAASAATGGAWSSALHHALERCGVRQPIYVSLQGLALPTFDRAEDAAVAAALAQADPTAGASLPPLASTPVGATGHALGVGGALGAVLAAQVLESGSAPPVAGMSSPLPHLGLRYSGGEVGQGAAVVGTYDPVFAEAAALVLNRP